MDDNLQNKQSGLVQNMSKSSANKPNKRPNETGSFSVEAHVKIFDPETKEVFVEKRA